MPDLHPYMKSVPDAFAWYFAIEKQILASASEANRHFVRLAKVSNMENWEKYRVEISGIAKRNNEPVLVEIRMDGQDRYWIIDVDYSIIDQYKHAREIGCIQIDVGNASRLGISYSDKEGHMRHPVIIHAAVPGGIERYLYMLFDQFRESFPFWLHPVQLRLIPVGERYIDHCQKLANSYPSLRIEIDDRPESVSKRIKRAYDELVPQSIIVGENELKEKQREVAQKLAELQEKNQQHPFFPICWPRLISRQVR